MKHERSYYFYDLETTGINSREDRIMQFAGQRTDMELNPIEEPTNTLIKITPDVMPSPDAILVTGITPQQTLAEGVTEAEFTKLFFEKILRSNTIFVGFNNIRFDDEFMRHLFFRNYYDAYGWQWEDGCSRFDILDLSRATRALSPDGINWPVDAEGKPTNRLELLSAENSLAHEDAHDALSDVNATIAVAKMIKDLRPRLFGHYLRVSNKREVRVFIKNNRTFVYTSGKYPGEYEKTTIVYNLNLEIGDKDSETLVYDLRINPADLVGLSPKELADRWRYNPEKPEDKLPIKSLKFNRCPAIARETVLDAKVCKRLKLDTNVIRRHQKILEDNPKFFEKILQAQEILNQGRQEKVEITDLNAQTSLYSGGFIPDSDKRLQSKVATSSLDELRGLGNEFKDKRLRLNMPSYIARNFPNELDEIEKSKWQDYCRKKLREGGKDSPAERFNARLTQLAGQVSLSREKKCLVEELNLYAQSVLSELEA